MSPITALKKDDGSGFQPFGSPRRIYPNAESPDLRLYASAACDRYQYTLADPATKLQHHACGILPRADEHAVTIYSVVTGLQNVNESRINGLLCGRYGYATRRDAKASKRRLMVEIFVSDSTLAELGNVLANSSEDVLPFIDTPNTGAYATLSKQLARFDVEFKVVPSRHRAMETLQKWADETMGRVTHTGPVLSPKLRVTRAVVNSKESAA